MMMFDFRTDPGMTLDKCVALCGQLSGGVLDQKTIEGELGLDTGICASGRPEQID